MQDIVDSIPPTEAGTFSGPSLAARDLRGFPKIQRWFERCRRDGAIGYRAGLRIKPTPARSDLIRRFLRLTDAPDDAIFAFAADHCALGLCPKHGLPFGHDPFLECRVPDGSENVRESIDAWRQFARLLRDLQTMAEDLKRHRYDADLWRSVHERLWHGTNPLPPMATGLHVAHPETAKVQFAYEVNRLLHVCRVAPATSWKGAALSLQYAATPNALSSLPAILPIQLVAAINTGMHSLTCSNPACRKRFSSDRKPRIDRRHYCEECRKLRAPERIRQREKRVRDGRA